LKHVTFNKVSDWTWSKLDQDRLDAACFSGVTFKATTLSGAVITDTTAGTFGVFGRTRLAIGRGGRGAGGFEVVRGGTFDSTEGSASRLNSYKTWLATIMVATDVVALKKIAFARVGTARKSYTVSNLRGD